MSIYSNITILVEIIIAFIGIFIYAKKWVFGDKYENKLLGLGIIIAASIMLGMTAIIASTYAIS